VLQLTHHLRSCAELAAPQAAAVLAHAALDAVHSAQLGTQTNEEHIRMMVGAQHWVAHTESTAARSTAVLVHLVCQCAQEAGITPEGIAAAATIFAASTDPRRPLGDVLWLSRI
jgi:hypothetical protein